MADDACPRLGRWIGGCRFEPRYHIEEPTEALETILARQWGTSRSDNELLVRKMTYIGDVCTRCGKMVVLEDGDANDHDPDS